MPALLPASWNSTLPRAKRVSRVAAMQQNAISAVLPPLWGLHLERFGGIIASLRSHQKIPRHGHGLLQPGRGSYAALSAKRALMVSSTPRQRTCFLSVILAPYSGPLLPRWGTELAPYRVCQRRTTLIAPGGNRVSNSSEHESARPL